VASAEGVVGTSVATGEGEDTAGAGCRVGENADRGVTVAVSCGCEVGVAFCKGVAVVVLVATGVWRNRGVALTVGDGTNSRTGFAVERGLARRDGAVGETVAAAAGILGDGAICRDDAVGVAKGACVGEAAGDANADPEAGSEVSAVACADLRKVFDGALGGGVDSDLILTRAFSAACRSAIPSQPWSTVVCTTVSFTFRGRSAGCAVAIAGAGIWTTSPRMTERGVSASTFAAVWRSKRRRSIGCSLRTRSSS
jgi:hypothetical protein